MKIYVTFGQQYRHEKHPVDSRAHPDGYFEYDLPEDVIDDIMKQDRYNLLYKFVIERLGFSFSEYYPACNFNKSYYPRGKLNGPEVNTLHLYEDYFRL